jgi:hypothetical protein
MKFKPVDMHAGEIICADVNTEIQLIPGAYYSVSLYGTPVNATAYEVQYQLVEDAAGVTYEVDNSTAATKLFGILTPPSGWVNVKLTGSLGNELMTFNFTKIAQ